MIRHQSHLTLEQLASIATRLALSLTAQMHCRYGAQNRFQITSRPVQPQTEVKLTYVPSYLLCFLFILIVLLWVAVNCKKKNNNNNSTVRSRFKNLLFTSRRSSTRNSCLKVRLRHCVNWRCVVYVRVDVTLSNDIQWQGQGSNTDWEVKFEVEPWMRNLPSACLSAVELPTIIWVVQ